MSKKKNEKKEYKYKCSHCSAVLITRLPYWMVNPPITITQFCINCDRKRIFKPSV